MEINNPFYTDILKALNNHGVRYILVGGLAVAYHGYSRYTGDMDLWIKPEKQNMENLYSSLTDLGYPEDTVKDIRKNREISNPTPIKLKDDQSRLKVDLMTNIFQKEFTWQECFDEAKSISVGEVKIPVLHINHLIKMKENSNRLDDSLKDLVDAQELKKIKNLKKQKKSRNKRK